MDFTRQGNESGYIIKSKQGIVRRVFAVLLAAFMWVYAFGITLFFSSSIFNFDNEVIRVIKVALNISNKEIRIFLGFSLILFVLSFLGLFIWKHYNKSKYGSLNRRKSPNATTDKDMLSLGLVDECTYYKLKNEKIIRFESNPIKDL